MTRHRWAPFRDLDDWMLYREGISIRITPPPDRMHLGPTAQFAVLERQRLLWELAHRDEPDTDLARLGLVQKGQQKMAETLTFVGELTVVTCWCGMRHAVPSELRQFQLREHESGRRQDVFCPLGHQYAPAGKSLAAQERERRERAELRERQTRDQLEAAERSNSALKGQATKLRKRVANGVCPCCHRTFENLARHMGTKHPDFATEVTADAS